MAFHNKKTLIDILHSIKIEIKCNKIMNKIVGLRIDLLCILLNSCLEFDAMILTSRL